ncbi:hypothetical protein [Bowmanella sp. JS7-9]|uniref:DUF3806 domain-containing protein n=1 Tax=Pseudobowmanella zhangzhouensis TaxID=1537679 RepID=A0ABW1XNY5_9ALTE|nr:hypothetical protein [Bowmanella sp. JS7-9]TBX21943.1 hypothetical protein TK45_10675 [Bowmanella sp. JS7-9]
MSNEHTFMPDPLLTLIDGAIEQLNKSMQRSEQYLDEAKKLFTEGYCDKELRLAAYLMEQGYEDLRKVNGMWCGTMRMLFTHGVFIDLDHTGQRGRICFVSKAFASLFLKEWDGKTLPAVGEDGCTAIKVTLPNHK